MAEVGLRARLMSGWRRSTRFGALAAVFAFVSISGCAEMAERAAKNAPPRSVLYRAPTMGTWGAITIVTADSAASAPLALAAKGAWDHVNASMSNWVETSELSRMNREAANGPISIDPEVGAVLSRALRIGAESGGAFDVTVEPLVRLWGFLGGEPRVPNSGEIEALLVRIGLDQVEFDSAANRVRYRVPGLKVDFGGIAKGYGVDLALEALVREHESLHPNRSLAAMINLSGNIKTTGAPVGRDAWRVGVRDPRDRIVYFGTLRLEETSMATSGNYEQFVAQDGKRYGHILDPRTGWPTDQLLSATAVTESAMDADGWSTALYVLGPEEAKRVVREKPELRAILVEPGGDGQKDVLWLDRELDSVFDLEPAAEEWFEVRVF